LLCGAAPAQFAPPQRVVVVTDINFPPYLFQAENGDLQGILTDKWALWSERTGVQVQLQGLEWKRAQQGLLDGAADVIEALSYTEARTRFYEYSPPYAPIEARVYFHKSISGINDVPSLRGFAIAAKDGSACAGWLAARGVEAIRNYPTSEGLVKAAAAGDVRMFCMDAPAAQYYLYKLGLADEFRQSAPLYTSRYHWAVKKGRADLRDFIQAGFQRISAKELEDIDGRWLGNPLRFPIAGKYLYWVVFGGAALLFGAALLILWNRGLSGRVAAKTAELNEAMQAVGRQAVRMRDLYDNAPCGYHSLDTEGRIVEVNDTELRWLGRSRDEVLGHRFTEFVTPAGLETFEKAFPSFKRDGSIHDLEYELVHRDGSTRPVLLSATLQLDESGSYVKGRSTLYDVSERKHAEQEVLKLNAELEQRVSARTSELADANRELEAFAYSVSHDLRAPLRSIDRYAHLALAESAGRADQAAGGKLREHLQRVRSGCHRMAELIEDLLALSSVTRLALNRRPVDVTAMALEVCAELRTQAPARSVALTVQPGIVLQADASLLRILLENLLGNAWKFTERRADAAVEVSAERLNGETVCRVRDNGAGFDMRYADKLFKAFERLHSDADFGGTGIGLAIVQRIAQRHGGRVWAKAEPGSGAAFYFTL
jgi:PAS domain S-box-containing protein